LEMHLTFSRRWGETINVREKKGGGGKKGLKSRT